MVPRADIRGVAVESGAARGGAGDAGGQPLAPAWSTATISTTCLAWSISRTCCPSGATAHAFSLEQVMRPVLVVPPSMRVLDLLLEMRRRASGWPSSSTSSAAPTASSPSRTWSRRSWASSRTSTTGPAQPQLVENPDGTIDADGRVYLEELEEKLGVAAAGRRGSRRGRHAGRPDLHPGRPGADAAARWWPIRAARVRGAGRRSAPDQAGADPPPCRPPTAAA